MQPKKNVPAETAEELCKRADAEKDPEKLLELLNKIQQLMDARRSQKNPPAE